MSQYGVIGTSPAIDTSVLVGPFRSENKAREAAEDLTVKGYNTEVCQMLSTGEVETSLDWAD